MYKRLPPGYITKSTVVVLSGGGLLFVARQYLNGNERFHREQIMPVARRFLDGESAHRAAVLVAKHKLFPPYGPMHNEYPELETQVLGMDFKNPIGLAAGFDKNGEALAGLRKAGFGFIEAGTVTPLPQPGNLKPRVFRLIEDEAVINRYGFNNVGHGKFRTNLKTEKERTENRNSDVKLGANVGQNKDSIDPKLDYSVGVSLMGPFCDYVVINVSSPNTPNLRSLQHKTQLKELLSTALAARDRLSEPRPKLLLKVAPDLTDEQKADIAAVCTDKKFAIDGLIVSNTTISRPDSLQSEFGTETGGLSGAPLRGMSTECVRDFYRLTKGRLPIIGSGGVASGQDAYDKIRAGASLVQIYTALVYQGFPVIGRIKRELAECVRKDGFSNISEAIGADHRN